ncbi:hypothetical protein NMG60_11008211 [Bertholletia excelsa]
MRRARICELCSDKAILYCPSDSAFLCWNCDAKVHRANFLVARHVRFTVCSKCIRFMEDRLAGVDFQPFRLICRSCSHQIPSDDDNLDSFSSSSASDCLSSAESSAAPLAKEKVALNSDRKGSVTEISSVHSDFRPRFSGGVSATKQTKIQRLQRFPPTVESEAEGVLVNWCRRLGLGTHACAMAVPVAMRGLGHCICAGDMRRLPCRVWLASSLWLSLRLCGERSASTSPALNRLEEISGVPAKLIVAWESKIARLFRSRTRAQRQRDLQLEEGWAESTT